MSNIDIITNQPKVIDVIGGDQGQVTIAGGDRVIEVINTIVSVPSADGIESMDLVYDVDGLLIAVNRPSGDNTILTYTVGGLLDTVSRQRLVDGVMRQLVKTMVYDIDGVLEEVLVTLV